MRPGEFCEVDVALYFKWNNESFFFSVIFHLTPEIKIKGEKESGSFEENFGRAPQLLGDRSSQDKWRKPAHRVKWKEAFHTVEELGMLVKDKKGTWIQKV